ncbi:hypothetical protein KFL_001660130 [Klebsormidium nitens]|uniref:Phytase-like domain-containing protein n=1 Tax=Klebsormidium nitens TaxID=105231 RepID=A0A1Y1I577_KLENI|nr:hypothetical protein KFL_001660130 [Klebsormidium nitens]|eukprot:GAQ83877.1 hypothetical protein KFL_001660130 [Klebsormidium nitens]
MSNQVPMQHSCSACPLTKREEGNNRTASCFLLYKASVLKGFSMAVSRALVSVLLLASCALAAAAPASVISQKTYFQLIKRVFFGNTTSGPCSVNGSNYLDIDLGPGSGAFVIGDNLWTITDRGANVDCQGGNAPGGAAGTTLSKACQATGCPKGGTKVYPIPDFSPTIQRKKLPDVFTGTPTPVETIIMKKGNGQGISGLPNFRQADNSSGSIYSSLLTGEDGYGPDFALLAPNPFGQDTEGIVVTSANADGTGATFWISEEYGPSVSKVGSDGTVLARHVPAGVVYETFVARANPILAVDPTNGYPIYPTFPSILVKRELNRGFENLAYFGKYLYAILQSPMANPGETIQAISRVIRLFKLELNDAFPGGAQVVGEYVYFAEDFLTFPQDQPKADQSNIKLGDAVAIAEDVILVDEHVTLQIKLFRIELAGATNILGSKWDDVLQSPTPRAAQRGRFCWQQRDPRIPRTLCVKREKIDLGPVNKGTHLPVDSSPGITPVKKTLAFDSLTDLPAGGPQLPSKVESLAIYGDPSSTANPARIILDNDNDFGISGATTFFTEIAVDPTAVFGLAATPPAPAPANSTATPTPTSTSLNCIQSFPAGGTCDYTSATPNQCFNGNGSSYTCCAGACGGAGSPPGAVAYCSGQVPGTTPVCGSTPAPTPAGTPAGTPAATPAGTPAGSPAGTPAGTPASTPAAITGAPGPTAFPVGGTCNAGSSLPNQVLQR